MFVHYNKKEQKIPIKIWAEDEAHIENSCMEQALHLANLPFAYKWVALMPDTHQGYGMPIGGVLATQGAIVPNSVGVDIGCGMAFVQTNISAKLLLETKTTDENLVSSIVNEIMRVVPTGFAHHQKRQLSKTLDTATAGRFSDLEIVQELLPELEAGYYQIGTLGGGNHFIELQGDEEKNVAIMIHTGSRNFGKKVCDHFNNVAKKLNQKWYSVVPSEWDLAFLADDTPESQSYIAWMNLALAFAAENRDRILSVVKNVLYQQVEKYAGMDDIQESLPVNCHHNYATLENHFGANLWVHRKGAISARKGVLGIIPGAMGGFSYIVEGLGNPESFNSCSHGAGRKMSRKEAMRQFSQEDVARDLSERGIILGKVKREDVAEEARFAYKDIDAVLEQEQDLVRPIKKLKTIAVVKG